MNLFPSNRSPLPFLLLSCFDGLVRAIYLDGNRLTAFQIFGVAFHPNECHLIRNLSFRNDFSVQELEQLDEYLQLIIPDKYLWRTVWLRWAKEYRRVYRDCAWEKDIDRYTRFATFLIDRYHPENIGNHQIISFLESIDVSQKKHDEEKTFRRLYPNLRDLQYRTIMRANHSAVLFIALVSGLFIVLQFITLIVTVLVSF